MSDACPPSAAAARYARSTDAFTRARRVMPGGVNSPVRAYKAVGRDPVFVTDGQGPYVTDADGNRYIDYVGSFGPLILGHAHPAVVQAISAAAARGTTFGMPTEGETALAEMVIQAVPSIEVVRFVNSGTEATMSAIRLARAATDRPLIVKCTGCYHGHHDSLLVEAGSGATTLGTPSSPGVPESITANTLLVPFNDLPAVAKAFEDQGERIAAMIVEPIAGNMGCVPPAEGYLDGLRSICDLHGALLIFDEVMTGFRVAYGGAQDLHGVRPDLTCLGKIVGGGLPCAAYGGREKFMRMIAPDGPVYQAGTLSGNPLAVAAGLAQLKALRDGDAYAKLGETTRAIVDGIESHAFKHGIPVQCSRVGSMATVFFSDEPVTNYEQARKCDTNAFALFFGEMLDRGVVLPPSQFETWFVSTVHDDECVQKTIDAAGEAFNAIAAMRTV